MHVYPFDWQEMDVALKKEEPKLIKVGCHLIYEEVSKYKDMIVEYINIFA